MSLRLVSALIAPAVAAAALALAAPAGASSNPVTCRDTGPASVCQKSGHASLTAEPQTKAPSGSLFSNAWLPGYGKGHLPPLIALD